MDSKDTQKDNRILQGLLSSSTFMHMPFFNNDDHGHGHVHGPSCNHGHDHDHANHIHADQMKSPATSGKAGAIGE